MRKKLIFDPPLQQYKSEIQDIYLAINNVKSTNRQLSIFFYQFLIHHTLTQRELRELTHFSLGFISESLKYCMNFGVVTRATIEGTNEYEYTLIGSFMSMSKILFTEIIRDIHMLQSTYYLMLGELVNPQSPNYSVNNQLILGLKRMLDYLDKFELFTQGLSKMFSDSPQEPIPPEEDSLKSENLRFHTKFNDLITIFSNSKVLPYNQLSRKKLFAAMLLLGEFTKKDLKKQVKMSYKTFTEHFTFFKNERKILEEIEKEGEIALEHGKLQDPIYRMKTLDQILNRNVGATNTALVSKIIRLQKIKTELEDNRTLMKHENGYTEILGFINDYFEITAKLRKSRPPRNP